MSVNFNKIRGPRGSVRSEVPDSRYRTVGFGNEINTNKTWNERIAAVRIVHGILQGDEMPAVGTGTIESLEMVKSLFSTISTGNRADWFTLSRLLGHPSAYLSAVTSRRLALVRAAIMGGRPEIFDEVVSRLYRDYIPDMLEHYLSMAVDASHPIVEEGWAYILWSSSEADVLHIGAAGGTVDDVLRRLWVEHPEKDAYGVLGAWLVHDAGDAYGVIEDAFDDYALGEGFYRIGLGEAKRTIIEILRQTANLSHSPWHSDQSLPRLSSIVLEDGTSVKIQ